MNIETHIVHFKEDNKNQRLILSIAEYDDSIANYKNLLSEAEIEKLNRIKVKTRQNEFIAGRVVVKNSLGFVDNTLTPNNITISNGVWGFPLIDSGNLISIAHTKQFVAGVISELNTHPIGIDIEEIKPENAKSLNNFMKKYKRQFTLEELHIYWSAKEAVAKALRTGFTIPDSIFEISELEYNSGYITVKFKQLSRLQVTAWINNNLVICIAYPTEWKFDKLQNTN